MNILIVDNSRIPVEKYGGVERVIWWLGKELVKKGHRVSYLVADGSECPFGDIYVINEEVDFNDQIPDGTDVVHFNFPVDGELKCPYLITHHGNYPPLIKYNRNTVFLTKNHAERYNSETYVYLGLDLDEYGPVNWEQKRDYFLFLGHSQKAVKNLKGCIEIAGRLNERLGVIGGEGVSDKVDYFGFIGGSEKSYHINGSKALLFPVLWHEPFGLAITESLYFGLPVFGSAYGSLPELIGEFGVASNDLETIIEGAANYNEYNRRGCHEYVCDYFSAEKMTNEYLKLYEKVMNKEFLNDKAPICIPNYSNSLVLH